MCAPESLVAAAGIFGFMTAVAVGLVAAMLNSPVAGGGGAFSLDWSASIIACSGALPFCRSVTSGALE